MEISEEIKDWLREGEQSKITSRITEIVSNFKGNDFEKIIQTLEWIEENISSEKDSKKVLEVFASRTADRIIQEKKHMGCHDTALLLATFLRGFGIPAKYVVGIDKLNPSRKGHVVVEAYVGKIWILIDPSYYQLNAVPSRSFYYKENHILCKGKDSWDCGIRSYDDWKNVSSKLVDYIMNFKLD